MGHSTVSNGSQWARSGHVTTAYGTAFGYQTSGGQEGVVRHGANGTVVHTNNGVYAGQDGNVYRKNSDGGWSEYSKNGNWSQINSNVGATHQPNLSQTNTMQNLNRSEQSRERGQLQSSRFQNFQRTGQHFGGNGAHWHGRR